MSVLGEGDSSGQGRHRGWEHLTGEGRTGSSHSQPPAPRPPGRQVEHWGHHVHAAGWLAALLAPEADAHAEDDHEWQLPVWLARMG